MALATTFQFVGLGRNFMLLESLRLRKETPDFEQQLAQFAEVYCAFKKFENRSESAEILALWTSRFKNLDLTVEQQNVLANENFAQKLADLLLLITDRWVSGDPSFNFTLRKSLVSILTIRTKLYGIDDRFADFVKHVAAYRSSNSRIAYGVLEVVARQKLEALRFLPDDFIAASFKQMPYTEAHAGAIGHCLAALLGPKGPDVWFEYTQSLICNPSTYQAVMLYFVQPVLNQSREAQLGFGRFYELCKPLSNPTVEVGLLTAAHNAKIDVSRQIRESQLVAQSLSSIERNLRFDALRILCSSTLKLSEPVPMAVFDLIMENADALLAESRPKARTDVCGALKNLLIRINVSKSQDRAAPFQKFIAEWCIESLRPGMPYRCLNMAARLLLLFEEMKFSLLSTGHAWHQRLLLALLNCVVSDYNDIREMAVRLLDLAPSTDFYDNREELAAEALKLMASSRNGEAGARLWQFLYPQDVPTTVLDEALGLVKAAEHNLDAAVETTRIHGFLVSLKLSPPKDKLQETIKFALRVCRVCTPPLTDIAPEGEREELVNYCWKAIKESCLLLEARADDITEPATVLRELAYMLTEITHWGAFTAVAPPFAALAKRDPETSSQIVWAKINSLSSGSNSRSVTRRSAGLPLLVTSCLESWFDPQVVNALFDLANLPFNSQDDAELQMSQVHGMNCIRGVVTAAGLSKPSTPYLSRAFEQCLLMFNSPSWSLRNCAAMLFSSLFKRLFGVQGLPIAGPVFFQRYKTLHGMLTRNLSAVSRDSDLHAVFPALVILGKLRPVRPNEQALDVFWPALTELIGSKAWKIRELAAHAIATITHPDTARDAIETFCDYMSLSDQNELHGLALSVRELLKHRPTGLQVSQRRLENLIKVNKCMETNAILYKCYAEMVELNEASHRRLIEKLPQYANLNPSLAILEAEQVAFAGLGDLLDWDAVVPVVPASAYTFDYARQLLDSKRLPVTRVTCLRSLDEAEQIPLDKKLELVRPLIAASEPPSIREAAVVFLSHHVTPQTYCEWIEQVSQFANDEDSPAEYRRSAVQSLRCYLSSNKSTSCELMLLLRLLTDEDEDIRNSTSALVSEVLDMRASAPGKCVTKLVGQMDPQFLASILASGLVESASQARAAFKSAEDAMFIVERENGYRDDFRFAQLLLQHCRPSAEDVAVAQAASRELAGLDFEAPLGAAASTELVTIKLIADGLTSRG